MNKIILKLGFWSAMICLACFIIWIVAFIGIAISSPLFFWTNMEDYIHYVNENAQFFQYLAKSFMIVFALAFLILTIVFHEITTSEKKILSKISVAFAVMFTLLISVHYFVQISAVRFAINNGHYDGLEHFLQAMPTSVISSVNMLGWTLFFGLSSLFQYFAFKPDTATKTIRLGLLINGISCLSAGVGFLLQIDVITFIFINLGVGGAVIFISISAMRYFNRLRRKKANIPI